MKKEFLFLCIVLNALLSISLKGQFKDFDLKQYKNLKYDYKNLETNFQFNYYGSDNFYEYPQNMSNNSGSLSSFSNIAFWKIKSSDRVQKETFARFEIEADYSKKAMDKDEREEENGKIIPDFHFALNYRYYFNTKPLLFLGLEPSLGSGLGYSKKRTKIDEVTEINEGNIKSIAMQLPIIVGIGRIDPIQDARLAVYIFDDLNKNGVLKRIPGNEEILEFAEIITSIKMKRSFDKRLQKIKEITEISEFLSSKGIVNDQGAAYFTSLYDNWLYSSGPVRNSGYRLSARLKTFGSHNKIEQEIRENKIKKLEYFYESNIYGYELSIHYEREKPLNLFWQNSINAEAGFIGLNDDDNSYFDSKNIFVIGSYNYGYYPNSRTSILFGVDFALYYYFHLVGILDSHYNNLYNYQNGRISLNYYISERLLFYSNSILRYSQDKTDYDYGFKYKNTNLLLSFDAGIKYSIF